MKVCCIAIACLILAGCAGVQQALDETEHAATAGEADSSKLASLNAEIAQQPAEESTTVEEKETRADEANVDEAKADEANVDEPAAQSAADPASGLAVEEESAAGGAQAATAGGGADAAVVAAATALTCAEDTGARSKWVDHSETETTTGAAAAPEPPPPPLPDPLDRRQINRLVFSEIGEGLIPVHRSGTALYLLHDIDSNGYNDVFALAVRVDQPAEAEFANINDYTRLYRADRSAVGFYLCLFHQRSGTLFPADLIFLGERMVVDSFRPQAIVEGENTPFAVSVVFTTLQGRVQEWVIFSGGTPGRFSIQERSGELFRVEDIDKDGVIDVVIYEEIYEVGVGNETYLTWYEWDGREFSSRATVNVVRNLRHFLKAAFDAIRGKNWDKFSEHGLGSKMRAAAPHVEYSSFDVFPHVFTLAAVEDAFQNQPITKDDTIRRAVYSEIRENPFSQRDLSGFFFPLSVRFETSAGRNHLYTTRVYMLTNPFGERQFTFLIE